MLTYVYVVSENTDGPIKVGYAQNFFKRFGGIQSSNSSDLKFRFAVVCDCVEDAQVIERKIHKVLRFYWMRGEWFSSQSLSYLKIIINDIISGRKIIKDYDYFKYKEDRQ